MKLCVAAVLLVMAWAAPAATLATTVSHVTGNAQGETDEWGRPRNTIRIAFQLDHVGPGAGNQNVALDWSASWR